MNKSPSKVVVPGRTISPGVSPCRDPANTAPILGGFRVALDMAFGALSKYDFCFVGMGFPEVGSLGMEANGVGSKRILESADQAKSPRRILVRSLLKSRNKLREKYRELRAECKRWRNQAAAVERSRSTWRERALAHEASAQEDRAARAKLESQLQQLREQSKRREVESAELRAIGRPGRGGKKRVVNRLADCAESESAARGPVQSTCLRNARRLSISRGQSTANQSASHRSWGRRSLRTPPRPSAASKFPYRYQPGGRQRRVRWVATGRFGVLHWRSNW